MDLQKKLSPEMRIRLTGLAVLLGTALAAYIGIVNPLREVRGSARSVTWYPGAAAILPVGTIVGLSFLFLGTRAESVMKILGRNRAAGIAVAVLLAVLAASAALAADSYFRSLGYS